MGTVESPEESVTFRFSTVVRSQVPRGTENTVVVSVVT
jgi:hypothetical protein